MSKNKNNYFSSKSDVLKFLKPELKKSTIEKIYSFTIHDWKKDSKKILNVINKSFNSNQIIVRSSAKGEDSIEKSQAGNYDSILNVNSKNILETKKAIEQVIKSYKIKNNFNLNNQILIQKQTLNVKMSGVIFTRTPSLGSPYFVINFEEGKSTESVTKGLADNTIRILRSTPDSFLPKKWISLIQSVREIESILKNDFLDIEFGMTSKNVIIFQVRPITSIKNSSRKVSDNFLFKLHQKNKKKYLAIQFLNNKISEKTIFSDMSDWNPSEIIGNNPNRLDYSQYDYLIMNDSWRKGRKKIGYHDVGNSSLMVQFGNKPYVDVCASFNSLLPNNIKKKLRNKLLNYYLDTLSKNPFLHDKVEFEIIFSCYDLTIDSRLKKLKKLGFSQIELIEIKNSLLDFTNTIISNYSKISNNNKKVIKQMSINREKIKNELLANKKTPKLLLNSAEQLLKDCKKFGTIPFSTMARISFIGSILLYSIEKKGIVSPQFIEQFMNSISTPLSEFQYDFKLFTDKKISKSQFLHKYGHLRPGTYDITAPRYDSNNPYFDEFKSIRTKSFKKHIFNIDLTKILTKNGLKFDDIQFFDFIKDSIIQREKLKFEFTKNLSDALELISESGLLLGFNRKELSNLSIDQIIKSKNLGKNSIFNSWKKFIEKEKEKKFINNYFSLPSLIFSEKDFDIVQSYISKPNYITTKKIQSKIVQLESHDERIPNLKNKIILIQNADPGYDWIFTKKPSALITKYGGVASHMSIRCAEIGLPAAIGCGEIIFNKLINSSEILLDCKNQQIIILEHTINDEEVEIKKTLRYLGYIK